MTRVGIRLIAIVAVLLPILLMRPVPTQAAPITIDVTPEFGPPGTVVAISWWVTYPECGPIGAQGTPIEVVADAAGRFTVTHETPLPPADDLSAGWKGINYVVKYGEAYGLSSNHACFAVDPPPSVRYFPETQNFVRDGFLAYWEEFGGLPVFGYPITNEYVDAETGLTVQYFERARFEWQPGVWPERYDVLLGRLGYEQHPLRQPDYPPYPFAYGPPSANPQCRFFPMPPVPDVSSDVGYHLCRGFRAYWEAFGGLAVFGYPLSQEYTNPETGLVTQYFERARFEWHPGAWPERYDVLLGRLGAESLAGQ